MYRIFRKRTDSDASSRSKRSSSSASDISKATVPQQPGRDSRANSADSNASQKKAPASQKKAPKRSQVRDRPSDRAQDALWDWYVKKYGEPDPNSRPKRLTKKQQIDRLLAMMPPKSEAISKKIEENLHELEEVRAALKKNMDELARIAHKREE